jgi:adenylate kinase
MSSGELLRKEVMSGSPRGRKIYQLMADGQQVPNPVVDDIIAEAMVNKKDATVRIFEFLKFSKTSFEENIV